jgi:isopenicillin N synthase-like dioxygenase
VTEAKIPVISVAGGVADAALADQLTDIFHRIGFVVVVDHGVPASLLEDVFASMERFFSLTEAEKRSIDKLDSPWFRGWEAVGSEYTNNRRDEREQIDFWSEWPSRPREVEPHYLRLLGPNQWPPTDIHPGLEVLMSEWYAEMGGLAERLLTLIALGLRLSPDHFSSIVGPEPMSLTKLIHYPPTPEGGAGVNAHHDAGFLTVLAAGDTPGLEVAVPDKGWVTVPSIDGGLVINLGENLQALTGNYLVATPHRVITAEERYSAGYFHGPSLDVSLAPLDLDPRFVEAVQTSEYHRTAGFMARKEETEAGTDDMASDRPAATYGEQLWNYFERSYPANMARHHADLITTETI